MIRIGIIGAGAISEAHLDAYKLNSDCKVTAIADLNLALANERAEKYGIEKVYDDYKKLLADNEIDAVSIVTPTFTHTQIVVDALKSGKNVLCEKPPALSADDVRLCEKTAKEEGKLLMYAFVCRFRNPVKYLKEYIESGKMGKIVYVEGARIYRCMQINGWFTDKTKVGGVLFDSAIHELDTALYLMGYPKPKTVTAFKSDVNSDLPAKFTGTGPKYTSVDTKTYERTIESFINGTVIFENGAALNIKSSSVLNSVNTGCYVDVCGEKAGARTEMGVPGKDLKILELTDDNDFNEFSPEIGSNNIFSEEINHFIDCQIKGTECICKPSEAVRLVEILNAIYKSAETGKPVEL